ncbi:hypothetical protein [Planctomicrobium piriforme]|uniref:Carboxypeptidase regulatory-like domain-containing protein n=1 Tax=Planctomicrobium piriforme TaxID=1576369 RepID=A0A1I3JVZ3_9PLAN|nr:hypothetical protein [Planctomicrobium piriforme]SFI64393.1 hypothetical protein SAMN05421753_11131 [Planctomicrobium piriforme]
MPALEPTTAATASNVLTVKNNPRPSSFPRTPCLKGRLTINGQPPKPGSVQISITPVTELTAGLCGEVKMGAIAQGSTTTDADGNYLLKNLLKTRYKVFVTPLDESLATLQQLSCGSEATTPFNVTVLPGFNVFDLQITSARIDQQAQRSA